MPLLNELPKVRGKYRENAILGKMCRFQVGGPADVLFTPEDEEDLMFFLKEKPQIIPYIVLGLGSNVLIRDGGFRGVAIRLGKGFNYANCHENTITAGAACLDLNIAYLAQEKAIADLEFLSGVPGTIGGAIAMNAGAYGREIKDILLTAKAVSKQGELKEFTNEEIGFKYRGNNLEKSWIFTQAVFQGKPGNKDIIRRKIEQIQAQRMQTQPIKAKTCGSTFRNPDGHSAWQLIDKAGCKGLQIGGAQVSAMHCNFFINTGNATAKDIESLINEVKRRVLETSGIELKEEVVFIG